MRPRKLTDDDMRLWNGYKRTYHCPPSVPDCDPVEVITDGKTIKIPWTSSLNEVEMLKDGGTVWLTIVGSGMPPVDITVVD